MGPKRPDARADGQTAGSAAERDTPSSASIPEAASDAVQQLLLQYTMALAEEGLLTEQCTREAAAQQLVARFAPRLLQGAYASGLVTRLAVTSGRSGSIRPDSSAATAGAATEQQDAEASGEELRLNHSCRCVLVVGVGHLPCAGRSGW